MSNVIISLLLYSFLFSEFQVNIIDLIQIQGNKKTKDHIILREINQKINESWSNESILEDENRIYNLGLFSNVDIDVIKNDENQNTYKISVSEMWYVWPFPVISYDYDRDELSYGAGIINNNFRGEDINLSFGSTFGNVREYFIHYQNPWISGDHISLELGVYNESSDHHIYNIIEKDQGFFIKGGFYKGYDNQFAFWTNYNNKIIDIEKDSNKSTLESHYLGQTNFSYIRIGSEYTYDTRDIYIDPSSGSFLNIELINEFGVNDTKNIHEIEFHFSTYKKIFESYLNPILKYKFSANIQYSNSDIPIFKKNYIGGQDYVRGYSATPSENAVDNYDNVFEVDNFLINTFEIQSTLIERKEYLDKVELGADFIFFTDWGIGYNLNKAINFDNSLLGYGIGCKIFLMNTVIKFEYALNMHGSSRWHLF